MFLLFMFSFLAKFCLLLVGGIEATASTVSKIKEKASERIGKLCLYVCIERERERERDQLIV